MTVGLHGEMESYQRVASRSKAISFGNTSGSVMAAGDDDESFFWLG